MAQPVAYNRAYSFTDWQSANPTDPLPGDEADGEFNAVGISIGSIRTNMALLQRDDGLLANGSVHPAALSTATKQLFAAGSSNFIGEWATATAYALGDLVHQSDEIYICVVAHTSGTFATDLVALKWVAIGAGSGGPGIYTPEQYGAVGNGVADDTTALEAVFRAAPDRSIIRLTPGKVYGIGDVRARPYNPFVEGTSFKSVTVIAYGATIKSLEDSCYNQIFFEGGDATDVSDEYQDYFHWFGGTFDNNKAEQQYPDAPYGDYPNSTVGSAWRENGGNQGMLGVRSYRQVVIQDVTLKEPIRDGVCVQNGDQIIFRNIIGYGQVPFNYQEMSAAGQTPREATYLKTLLSSSESKFENTAPRQVIIDGAFFDGGCMGYFHRANDKSAIEAGDISIRGMWTRNMARMSIWIEVADRLKVSHCNLHGEYDPADSYRGDAGGFYMGNGIRYADIDTTEIRNGYIEWNQANGRRRFTVDRCYIERTKNDSDDTIQNASVVSNTVIRTAGASAIEAQIVGPNVHVLEGGGVILSNNGRMFDSQIGYETQELSEMTLTSTSDSQYQFDLLAEDANLYSIHEVRYIAAGYQPETVQGGLWSYSSGTGILTFGVNYPVPENDQILVRYVAKTVDTSAAASGTTFDTSIRASSIVSVTVAGVAKALTTDYTLSRNSDNTVRVTLLVAASSEDVVITSLPWWDRVVGGITLNTDANLSNVKARGFTGVRCRGGAHSIVDCDLQLAVDDPTGAVFANDTGDNAPTRVSIRGGQIGRCETNGLAILDNQSGLGTYEAVGVDFFDFGLDNTLADADARCGIGGANNGANGEHLRVINCSFESGRSEIGASDIALRTRASVLTSVEVSGCRALNMNATPMSINAVASGGRRIRDGGLFGSGTYDPASLNDGARTSATTLTVTGAELGDRVVTSFSLDLQGVEMIAWVSAADTVSIIFANNTGGVVDLGSGTIRAWVYKSQSKLL